MIFKMYRLPIFWLFLWSMPMLSPDIHACTRVLHTFQNGDVVTGRSMDWFVRYKTALWKFPRGLTRQGLTPVHPMQWESRYGSIVVAQTAEGQSAVSDGINEKGLVANLLYLTETQYPKRDTSKAGIASSIYIQFLLDSFANVNEAVTYLKSHQSQIVPVPIPNSEHLPTMHISLSDATGDSAIVEFLEGKVVVHHSKAYQVMTNSPTFEKQLAINAYWSEVGGDRFLPGTRNSADRFVRASFYNKHLPEPKNYREAIASMLSIVRNVSSPFGKSDPQKPNISSTLWRTVADQKHFVYYFESTLSPNLIWVDLKKMDFSKGTRTKVLEIKETRDYAGEVNALFKTHAPLEFAKVPDK
jgi:choloylglycine hydrolase